MAKLVVVNADDFGICEATNLAIEAAHRSGVVTSTSLMANGPAFDHAVAEIVARNPQLGIGVHVCLTSGRSVAPPAEIPDLVDSHGRFRQGFLSLSRQLAASDSRRLREEIAAEVRAQFVRVAEFDVPIDHVDSHRHVHMIPPIFEIVHQVAAEFGCQYIRLADEPLPSPRTAMTLSRGLSLAKNLPKKLVLSAMARTDRPLLTRLRAPDRMFGILASGRITARPLKAAMDSAGDGVTEIVSHPGGPNPDVDPEIAEGDRIFLRHTNRTLELEALVDPELRRWATLRGISFVRFSDIQPATSSELACSLAVRSPRETASQRTF